MKTKCRVATVIGLVIGHLSSSPISHGQQPQPGNPLVGTWKLVSWEFRNQAGGISYPMGERAVGLLTYDSRARMSAQLMRANRPLLKSGDLFQATPEEVKAAFEGFLAYYGTYTIDETRGTVTHHVQAGSVPNDVGTDLVRFFTLSGTRLTLRTAPRPLGGQTGTGTLVWERLD